MRGSADDGWVGEAECGDEEVWLVVVEAGGAAPLGRDVMEECAKKIPHAEICQVEISDFSFIFYKFFFKIISQVKYLT